MIKGQGYVNVLKISEGPYSQSLSNLEDNRLKSVSFAGSAYGDPSKFYWDFGDGTFDSTTLCPTHTYASYGTY
jgi:PKD repeat protein